MMMLIEILIQCYRVSVTFSPHTNNQREKHLNYPIKFKLPYVLNSSTSTETKYVIIKMQMQPSKVQMESHKIEKLLVYRLFSRKLPCAAVTIFT